MRKFLFVEYNMSGMKWVSPENPVFTLVEAATPAEALEKWVEDGAQCWTEECIEAQTEGHSDADSVLETAWGVDVKMFEVNDEYSFLPQEWLKAHIQRCVRKP